MQYVTIKDIARKLHLSVSTVSRAFNDKYDIKKETRQLILKTAEEMGYKPNAIARKLLQKHSFNVGVIVPEFINPFFPKVIIGIQDIFCKMGYQVIIMQSSELAKVELANIASMEENMIEGLLISLSKEDENIDYLKYVIKDRFPVVLFNRVNGSLPASQVIFNDYKWALFATEHLIEQGYKKIFHFAGPANLTLIKNRIRGFTRAMEKYRLPCGADQIIETGLNIEDGELAMETLIQRNIIPEAIFATSDYIAVGAMKVLKKYGYKIPEDVGIMGFSNSKLAEVVDPPLSSVEQPTYEMGTTAANLLLNQLITNDENPPKTVVLDGRIIIRESSLKKS